MSVEMENPKSDSSSGAGAGPAVKSTALHVTSKFVPRPPNPAEPTLIWKMSETRTMFKNHRLWPSFVGAKVETGAGATGAKASMGLLPVMLWPEQEAFLKENGYSTSSGQGLGPAAGEDRGTKRKRDDAELDGQTDSSSLSITPSSSSSSSTEAEQASNSVLAKKPRSNEQRGFFGAAGQFLWGVVSAPFNALGSVFGSRKKFTNADLQLTIFRECAKMGYFIGPGDVYGGDYNIYRGGDPSNSHSTATIKVVRRKTITGRDLLSFSRVQNQVAKSAVLAFIDSDTKEPKFLVANFRNVSERV